MKVTVTCPACRCEIDGSTYDVGGDHPESIIAGEAGRVATRWHGMPVDPNCPGDCTCHTGVGVLHRMIVSLTSGREGVNR